MKAKEILFFRVGVLKRYWFVFAIIIGGIIVDQITKSAVFSALGRYSSVSVIPKFFHITTAENDGAAFSILRGKTWFFIATGCIATVGFVAFLIWHKEKCLWFLIPLSMIISGTLGNLADRIVNNGLVRDFFHIEYLGLEIFGSRDFPIFNVADMLLVFGTITFCIYYVFMFKPPEKTEVVCDSGSELGDSSAEEWTAADKDEVV